MDTVSSRQSLFISLLNQFKQIGVIFENGVVKAKEFIAEKITANIGVFKKVEIQDEDTGETYCVKIKSGVLMSIKDECNTQGG